MLGTILEAEIERWMNMTMGLAIRERSWDMIDVSTEMEPRGRR